MKKIELPKNGLIVNNLNVPLDVEISFWDSYKKTKKPYNEHFSLYYHSNKGERTVRDWTIKDKIKFIYEFFKEVKHYEKMEEVNRNIIDHLVIDKGEIVNDYIYIPRTEAYKLYLKALVDFPEAKCLEVKNGEWIEIIFDENEFVKNTDLKVEVSS